MREYEQVKIKDPVILELKPKSIPFNHYGVSVSLAEKM
jgi:hypothetical protein